MYKLTIIAATLTLLAGSAVAQSDYPTRPVTVIVPFAAGGPTDTVARLVSESMTRTLGQQVLVENVAGAGGTLGARRVATRRSRRLHAVAAPHRPSNERLTLPQASVRSGDRLRWHRLDHRRADDGRRQVRPRAQLDRRADRVHQGQQRTGHARPCRRGRRLTPVRRAPAGRARHQGDDGPHDSRRSRPGAPLCHWEPQPDGRAATDGISCDHAIAANQGNLDMGCSKCRCET